MSGMTTDNEWIRRFKDICDLRISNRFIYRHLYSSLYH